MTVKRKAELQRKLALAPLPKPPADLAERIKRDIPKPLLIDAEKERFRLRQSVAFNIRVAASIILLVSSVYLALHLLTRKFGPPEEAVMTYSAPAASNTQTTASMPVVLPTNPPSPESMNAKAQKENERKQIIVAQARQEPIATRNADEEANAETGNAAGRVASADTQSAPAAVAPPPPAAAPMPVLAQAPAVAAESDSAYAPQRERAGITAPMAKTAALGFDVEASAAPFDASKQIVRISIDGARDAAADVAFNDDAVASWHTLTSDGTSLYEITLRPHAGPNDVIATARVNSMERVIRRSDLRSWNDASRRMKYAALAAALDAGVSPKDVAAKARAAGLDDLAAAADAKRH